METNATRQQRLQRERTLLQYHAVLERGDLEAIERILTEAEADPELEEAIWELHVALAAEDALDADAVTVRTLAASHFSAGLSEESELAPLTVGDVAARLRAEGVPGTKVDPEVAQLAQRLAGVTTPLPDDLTRGGVRTLFEKLGLVAASRRMQEMFRDTAIFLAMGQRHTTARLAATRRQQTRAASPEHEELDKENPS